MNPGFQRLRRHLDGEGGIHQLLTIALPMFVSQAADTLMMFVSRFFLARLGREHMAAAMTGGLTAFMTFTFFIGVIGYGNALVAQYLGSGRRQHCGLAAAQGLVLALLSYPLVLLARPAGLWLLRSSGHDAAQAVLEADYFRLLTWFALLPLLRAAFGSFFCGIGKTRVVMVANGLGMLVNILVSYLLIFGVGGLPELGLQGAALGMACGSAVSVLLLAWTYLTPDHRRDFGTAAGLRLDGPTFSRLLRFGLPAGTEFFLNMTAFNLFVQFMHSYGRDVAAAVTIAFNWDMVAFVPLVGVSIATTSLVGRYMGAGRPDLAERSAYSGLKASLGYTAAVFVLFLAVPELLARPFMPHGAGQDYGGVIPQTVFMIRMASVYLLSDALLLVFGGALRGAGDTRWVMRVSVTCHWLFASTSWVLIRRLQVSPRTAWVVFVLLVTLNGCIFLGRFRGGRWKTLRVIEAAQAEDGGPANQPVFAAPMPTAAPNRAVSPPAGTDAGRRV
jgi:MATE family multidrug resistance protein